MSTMCGEDQPGCMLIGCLDGFEDTGQIYIAVNATGSGGMALNCNFQTLQFRQPKCDYSGAGDPNAEVGGDDDFCIGSRVLSDDPNPLKMWICVADASGAAVWGPHLR